MIKMLGILNEKKNKLKKDSIVSKNRGRAVITLKTRSPELELAIIRQTSIMGYRHGKTKHGYSYKFNGDMDWETALDLFS